MLGIGNRQFGILPKGYALGTGGKVDPYPSYLFYDDFSGSESPLNGRVPKKGPAWTATGIAGAGMTGGNGVMKQAAGDGNAGYGYVNQGKLPRKVVGEWQMLSGDFAYPAVMAICKDASFLPMLHGEGNALNFYLRLVAAGPTFINPLFGLEGANWTLDLNTKYRDELHYDGNKMAAMVKRDTNDAVLGSQLIYDFRMPEYVGNWTFWETMTDRIRYNLSTAEELSDYAWPTINEIAAIVIPTTADFTATIFGGSATNSTSGITISGNGYGQGQQINVGAVTVGDRFAFAFDSSSLTGTWEVALLKTGAVEAEKSNAVYYTSSGRISDVLVATETMAEASLAIVISPVATAGNNTVSNLQILKNPPTIV